MLRNARDGMESVSFVARLLDAVYLLNATDHTVDWDEVLSWRDNPMALASFYMMLSYLPETALSGRSEHRFSAGLEPGLHWLLGKPDPA